MPRGSTGLARQTPLRRTAMRPRYRPAAHSPDHWEQVIIPGLMLRSGGRCEVTGIRLDSGVPWSCQHRRSRNTGGSRDPEIDSWANLLVVSGDGTSGAHGWIESHNTEASRLGWAVPTNGTARPEDVPVVLFSGRRVLLSPDAPVYLPTPGPSYEMDLPLVRGDA